ncbi:MAG: hypothetical protein Q9N26_02265 [Aquificota bacterium]|nr:hypothetical protein [Aquificota bacterium]
MAEGDAQVRAEVFIKRARHLNFAFVFTTSLLFFASVLTYSFMALPVSPKLVLYVYSMEVVSGSIAYVISCLLRKRFPVRTSEEMWSYTAVRIYFWSYAVLCVPFGIAFLFYLFAGNLSALVLGYLISVCGLIIFRPRRGDVL